jgi:integrase
MPMENNEVESSRRYTREKALIAFRELAPDEDEDLVDAKAPRTLIQYGSVKRVWSRYREEQALPVLPATAIELRDFVRHLKARNLSPATLAAYVSALVTIHRYNGYQLDTTLVIEHLKAARRRYGPQRRAKPLLARVLKDLVDRLGTKLRDIRDKPLLMLAFAFAARSAEVVGLDLERAGSTLTGTTGIVTMEPDAIIVTLLTSKASQDEATEIEIPDREMPSLRPALAAWIERAGIRPGLPLFPATIGNRVTRRRMANEAILDIVRRRVAEYTAATGKSPEEAMALARAFSSHSIRRGYCTSASRARVPLADIRKRSRHRSDAMVARYVGEAEGRRSSGLSKVGF